MTTPDLFIFMKTVKNFIYCKFYEFDIFSYNKYIKTVKLIY